MKRSGSLEKLFLRSQVRCEQQNVGLHIRHRPERNHWQLVALASAALTAPSPSPRWKLGVEEGSNGPALGDRCLEIAMAISQVVEQMRSQEVVVPSFENTAVWNVNAGHDLAIRM